MHYTLLEFDVIDSTNDFLKEHHPYFPHFTCVRAGYQQKGRGQFDRLWESKAHENLLFSLLLKKIQSQDLDVLKSWVITQLCLFFNDYNIKPTFKEPNDLYVGDHKLCGILIETITSDTLFDVVIIGIGINVNQVVFETPHAISFARLTNQIYDIPALFQSIVLRLYQTLPAQFTFK